MLKDRPNINFTLKHDLCMGCGVCYGACPTNSILITMEQGMFRPKVNIKTCINDQGCSKCYDTCSGVGIKLKEISLNVFKSESTQNNKYIGHYENCYSGFSTNEEIRFRSSSGGLTTQLLIYLLEKKYVSGAIVTRFDKRNNFLVNTFIARSKDELISARGSKYSPVSFQNVISMVKNESKGKLVIVGLPCHIHSLRKYELLDNRFKKNVFAYFSLYCSSGRNFNLTEYVFKKHSINKSDLDYFAYRDEGCLGSLIAKGNTGKEKKPFIIKESYRNYYHPLRSFFIPKRCKLCIDHFGELGDISFGDIHIPPYSEDKIGISSVIVRKKWLNDIFIACKSEGYIDVKNIKVETLLKSQIMAYKKKSVNMDMIKIESLRGRIVPSYDIQIGKNISTKSVIIYIHTLLQIFIGKRKFLWPLISYLKDNRYK